MIEFPGEIQLFLLFEEVVNCIMVSKFAPHSFKESKIVIASPLTSSLEIFYYRVKYILYVNSSAVSRRNLVD